MGRLAYQTTESSAKFTGQATGKPSGCPTGTKRILAEDREFLIKLFEKEHEEKERKRAELEMTESLRQCKAAKSITKMASTESLLSYFEQIEETFLNEHINEDRCRVETLRQGLYGKGFEALLAVSKGVEINHEIAKSQVLTANGYSWHSCFFATCPCF